jgi:hypothetical protein
MMYKYIQDVAKSTTRPHIHAKPLFGDNGSGCTHTPRFKGGENLFPAAVTPDDDMAIYGIGGC